MEAARWSALKSHLALARKRESCVFLFFVRNLTCLSPVMRLGKPVEHLQAALRAAQTTGDVGEQLATIGRQIGYFGYLTYDAVVWVCISCSQ